MEDPITNCKCHRPEWSNENNDPCDCDNHTGYENVTEICLECTWFYPDEE